MKQLTTCFQFHYYSVSFCAQFRIDIAVGLELISEFFFFCLGQRLLLAMNLQQAVQPKLSGNGFIRRRGERDLGNRLESKSQSGKSNHSRSTNTGELLRPGLLSVLHYVLLSHSGWYRGNDWRQSWRLWESFT